MRHSDYRAMYVLGHHDFGHRYGDIGLNFIFNEKLYYGIVGKKEASTGCTSE